jgi:tetratricopeptide (TPR) repeat protein
LKLIVEPEILFSSSLPLPRTCPDPLTPAPVVVMLVSALQGYEEALGPKHTSTLQTVGNLGILYMNQGKLAEAEAMYTRALQGYEEALGPKHTSTLQTVGNLGLLYTNQG